MSNTSGSQPFDRVVVITGASGGIGAELARQAAARGARVVLAARREPQLREVAAACGANAHVVLTDVTRREDMVRLAAAAIARFGGIDAWVNNAGRGASVHVADLTDESLDTMITVNLKSALYGMQAVLPHFLEKGTGQIVNVSSMLGRVPFATVRAPYCAAKHALNALTACLRADLMRTHPGITVSTFSPGVVATEFGVNALHGGFDSRRFPGAQPVGEAAAALLDMLERPRVDDYSRPGMRERVAAYYAAEDMSAVEAGWAMP